MARKTKAQQIAEDWESIEYCDERKPAHNEILEDLAGAKIIMASYEQESYEGYAMVIFQSHNGTLWEVNGSHCSCHGLEGQWEPEETSIEALELRDYVPSLLQADLDKAIKSLKRRTKRVSA